MNIEKESYKKYVKKRAKKSPIIKNCIWAFFVGGFICCIGETLFRAYHRRLLLSHQDSSAWVAVTLIFLSALLTGLGLFGKIAKRAGAGTLVPITGFANSVVSPAIDNKSEGWILGVGAKIFTVAGPVLLYGILTGVAYGFIYYIYLLCV
ncbi:MAG: stage V sporulation protein AC [Clostridiales bacterium]|nr:stage V sporulation protein AC [Clostridiales bacterium]